MAWIFAVLLSLLFAFAGGIKLTGNPGVASAFMQIGLGQWFQYFTGIVEVGGAIALLIPKFRFWGALLIAIVMIGATVANLSVLHAPATAGLTVVLLLLALALAWLWRPQSS